MNELEERAMRIAQEIVRTANSPELDDMREDAIREQVIGMVSPSVPAVLSLAISSLVIEYLGLALVAIIDEAKSAPADHIRDATTLVCRDHAPAPPHDRWSGLY